MTVRDRVLEFVHNNPRETNQTIAEALDIPEPSVRKATLALYDDDILGIYYHGAVRLWVDVRDEDPRSEDDRFDGDSFDDVYGEEDEDFD